MHLIVRVFVLAAVVAGSFGCNAQKDAPLQSERAAQREQPKPSQPAEPAQPLPPKAAAAAPEDSNPLCMQVCRKAEGLKCPGAEDCKSGCQELLSLPGCQTAMVSFLECLSKEPLEHWECDSEVHVPAIRDGYCESQQREIAVCMGSAS
jgi:hypothetical protein